MYEQQQQNTDSLISYSSKIILASLCKGPMTIDQSVIQSCKYALLSLALTALISCGSGSGSGSGSNVNNSDSNVSDSDSPNSSNLDWVKGEFSDSALFAAKCINPRTGNNPQTGQAYDDQQGEFLEENHWLRSWSDELYLWYGEIIDQDPASFNSPQDYFEVLKTDASTSEGNPKDRFHFTYSTADWIALSQSGVANGYGMQLVMLASSPPRDIRVAYNQPNTSAVNAGLDRGAIILAVDGEDVINGTNVDKINAGLFPASSNETHTFTVQDLGTTANRQVSLVSSAITEVPVQKTRVIATSSGKVGYFLFNDHIATAEAQLIAAVNTLKAADIDDLVIDLRYNGGGYLAIASQLAYMIAGPSATKDTAFETMIFNDKHPSVNPITNQPIDVVPFIDVTMDFSVPREQALPSLDLDRVYVLTGSNTCSASEAIINSLRGIGINVYQFGATTCGKPYGFYPQDNCGTTYFSIQFRGENNAGFGDYADGFIPTANATQLGDSKVPGCAVADDLATPLGNIEEARLAAALEYRISGSCPAASNGLKTVVNSAEKNTALQQPSVRDGLTPKSPWLNNRIMRD